MKNAGIIIVGAAIAALLLFRKGDEGGSGGSLSIPLDVLGSGAATSAPLEAIQPNFFSKKATNTPSASSKVLGGSASWAAELAAIAKAGFSTEGIAGIYDPSTDTIYTQSDRWGVGPGQKPPRLDQATSKNGIDWIATSSAKKASSSGAGYNSGAGKVGARSSGYAYSGSVGGWGV